METFWPRVFIGKTVLLTYGINLLDWALPLQIASLGSKSLLVTLLCFYFHVSWGLGNEGMTPAAGPGMMPPGF